VKVQNWPVSRAGVGRDPARRAERAETTPSRYPYGKQSAVSLRSPHLDHAHKRGRPMSALGMSRDITRLIRQGSFTNQPDDPNYPNHWNHASPQGDERLVAVYPGVATAGRVRAPVNVRVVEAASGHVAYIDTIKQARVGPLAKLLGAVHDRSAVAVPARVQLPGPPVVNVQNRIQLEAQRQVQVTARANGFVGRPADLPWRKQLAEAWRFAKG